MKLPKIENLLPFAVPFVIASLYFKYPWEKVTALLTTYGAVGSALVIVGIIFVTDEEKKEAKIPICLFAIFLPLSIYFWITYLQG